MKKSNFPVLVKNNVSPTRRHNSISSDHQSPTASNKQQQQCKCQSASPYWNFQPMGSSILCPTKLTKTPRFQSIGQCGSHTVRVSTKWTTSRGTRFNQSSTMMTTATMTTAATAATYLKAAPTLKIDYYLFVRFFLQSSRGFFCIEYFYIALGIPIILRTGFFLRLKKNYYILFIRIN